ncbi:hypothetical protein MMC13_004527 [Lambiella insularis]|nr:hypothetical protein [Lambiella insularis]
MAKEPKTFFLAPTRQRPPTSPIVLGSIISSPANPELPINPPLPFDETLVSSITENNWKLELSKHKKAELGIWASFLQQIVGVGADASIHYQHNSSSVYHFKELKTRTFWPSIDYVKKSVMATEVQTFLAGKRFHHNVYMIIGISIASGASVAISELRKKGAYLHFSVDGTVSGAPASVGPKADVDWGGKQSLSYDIREDFVFAFRLREICYTTKKGLVQKEFREGALYSLPYGAEEVKLDDVGGEPSRVEVEEEQFDFLGLADEDVRGDDVGGETVEAEDEEGEQCECVVLES